MSQIKRVLFFLGIVVFLGLLYVTHEWADETHRPVFDQTEERGEADLGRNEGPKSPPVIQNQPVPKGRMAYREKISDYHYKNVSIYFENGLPYTLRKEEILNVGAGGETTVKNTVSYVANHILIGLNGDEVPESIKALGVLKPIKSITGTPSYVLVLKDWSLDTVAGLVSRFAEEPFSSFLRYAEPDHLVQAHVTPNDPELSAGKTR